MFVHRNRMPRARAPNRIVPLANIKTNADIEAERWTLSSLGEHLKNAESCLKWCRCTTCGQPASFVKDKSVIDQHKWRCHTHPNFKNTVRFGSFFQHSHLPLSKLICIIYCWSANMPQTLNSREAGIPEDGHTVIDWCSFLRNEAHKYVAANLGEIGGYDNNSQYLVVEIDESKFFHRKYQRGTYRQGHWVFGGIERGSGCSALGTIIGNVLFRTSCSRFNPAAVCYA